MMNLRPAGTSSPVFGTSEKSRRKRLKGWACRLLPKHLVIVWRLFRTGDWRSFLSFLFRNDLNISWRSRFEIIRRFHSISVHVPCEHLQAEMLAFTQTLFQLPEEVRGCVVECGCFKGGGTAKLSIVAKVAGRKLYVFDSFEGIPENFEVNERNIWGGRVSFSRGDYCGSLEEVKANVRRYGEIESCEFVKGLFQDTLPDFAEPVAAAFLDVDLAASTETCVRYLWPLLAPGGFLFSQDGHLPLVRKVLTNERFWRERLDTQMPEIHGLGMQKLIWMQKPVAACGQ